MAVEVGFEPTEGLPLHTLSSTAHHRSPPSASARDQPGQAAVVAGERLRTGVKETKTETTGWHARVPVRGGALVSVEGDLSAGTCCPRAMVPSDWLRVGRGDLGRSW